MHKNNSPNSQLHKQKSQKQRNLSHLIQNMHKKNSPNSQNAQTNKTSETEKSTLFSKSIQQILIPWQQLSKHGKVSHLILKVKPILITFNAMDGDQWGKMEMCLTTAVLPFLQAAMSAVSMFSLNCRFPILF